MATILRNMEVSTSHPTQADQAMQDNQVQQNQGQPQPLRKMQVRMTLTSTNHYRDSMTLITDQLLHLTSIKWRVTNPTLNNVRLVNWKSLFTESIECP